MKKRNRILSVLLCATMVAGLAGCGSKNDSEDSGEKDGKIKLTFSTSVFILFSFSAILLFAVCPAWSLSKHRYTFLMLGLSFRH